MKKITLSVIAIFAAILVFGQNEPTQNISFTTLRPTLNTVEQYQPTASGLLLRANYSSDLKMQYEGEHAIDKCNSYRKMKIAGIVLTAIGGGMIITGSIMRGSAYRGNVDGTINNYNYNALWNGGGAMIGVGALSLAAGIPLTIVGCVKTHRYCYRGY